MSESADLERILQLDRTSRQSSVRRGSLLRTYTKYDAENGNGKTEEMIVLY